MKATLEMEPAKTDDEVVKEWVSFYKEIFSETEILARKALLQGLIQEIRVKKDRVLVAYNPAFDPHRDDLPLPQKVLTKQNWLPVQYTQRTKFPKSVFEIIPFYYRFFNKTKAIFVGQKPSFLPKDGIPTQKEHRHYEYLNSYVNPIMKAKEYAEMLKTEGISRNQLAERMGISRVRVTQLLNLLRLPQERQDYVLANGKDELITERQLRKLLAV